MCATLKRTARVAAYAVAMAFVEAAVVVYLRALAPGQRPLEALRTVLPQRIVPIEVAREAATLVRPLAVAVLAGRGGRQRFRFFAIAFGSSAGVPSPSPAPRHGAWLRPGSRGPRSSTLVWPGRDALPSAATDAERAGVERVSVASDGPYAGAL